MAHFTFVSIWGFGNVEKSDLLHELRIDKRQREDTHQPRRWPWIVMTLAVLLIAAGGAAYFYFGAGQRFEVQVATAQMPSNESGNNAVLQATGYVTARRQATVSAQITGTLLDVLIEEGDHVEAGQVLAHLDSTAQQAQLAQAQAGVRAGQALLAQYQAQLGQNQRDLTRAQDLVGRKLVSAQSVEVASTQVATLTAQISAQRRQIEASQAGVTGAQVQLDYCTVRAPFTGVVIAKSAQVGEIVSPFSAGGGFTRTGVGTIVDMDSLEVEVDVSESYIGRVQPKQPAQAILDAYPDWKIPAHVIAIIPTADKGKATVKVRIAIEQKDPRLLPDMGARVSFLEEAKPANAPAPKGVLVPTAAIVQRDGKSIVFAIDGEQVHARAVTPGQAMGEQRLVEGLSNGTKVVLTPPAEMKDGAKISIATGNK
ncbi:efflux RND transporter periplasmic adaptor subunit [Pseudolysobacter antarcticus]|uniref:Efflux RND transporter periplasmic adaptor subunit n=1 Tax=Pseudolysobacter antarcticus TaxID=2511995 RepID=A0A411HN97_9GAMM|nr:efflux RND transporter periplasmic adaptor subunit [Pseudolysobacter antarcticus]QBB71961.1 efflux RND transporter periplasmic adaptor subunit [Pseudolysobacter antarcticus]